MKIKSFFLTLILLVFVIQSFSQKILLQWDSLIQNESVEILPMIEINSDKADYSPVLLNSGKLIFTSARINPKTRESALSFNQSIYEYNSQNGKIRYNYYYNSDDHSAIAGISSDASILFIYKSFHEGNIYYTSGLSGKDRYKKFKSLGIIVNSDDFQEQSASLWKEYFVFSSDREGNFNLYYALYNEKLKIKNIIPIDAVNSDSSECDVRFMQDGTLLFSSNKDGYYKSYFTKFDGKKWDKPLCVNLIPDSFNTSDVRDLIVYDSVFYFSNNKNGIYNIYEGKLTIDSIPPPEDPEEITPDSIVEITVFDQKLQDLEEKLDSMEFKPYRAFVQIGAYQFVRSVSEFKTRFPAFDTSAIKTEEEAAINSNENSIIRYIIDQTYFTLRKAALRQQDALKQQANLDNLFESPVDAFIAVYDNRDVRIVIFFNLEKKEFKILHGDSVVYF